MKVNAELLKAVMTIAKDAGEIILKHYAHDMQIAYKSDQSPLTLADTQANLHIRDSLAKLANLPYVSEESLDIEIADHELAEYFWLVDPLDGTKEFINKNGEFTVNIALINKNIPILGVVHAPALQLTYAAIKGEGAFKEVNNNVELLPILNARSDETIQVVASRSHLDATTQEFIQQISSHSNLEPQLKSIGSSLKLCLLAEDNATIYPRFGPTMSWDIAAGDCILAESKGTLMNPVTRERYHYTSQKQKINSFVACSYSGKGLMELML